MRVLEDFAYHRQFVGDNAVVLEFSAHIGSMSLKGVDIIQFNDAGGKLTEGWTNFALKGGNVH